MKRTSLLAFLLACSASTTAGAQSVVLKAGRLIDGRGGRPLVPAMVRLDRIVEVGARLAIPPGAASWTSARPPCCPGSSTSTPT